MIRFRAFRLEHSGPPSAGQVRGGFVEMDESQLDAGDVLIQVACSSLNVKDALAASGAARVVRRYPCVGGLDLAGTVLRSVVPHFPPGSSVIATGYELGVAHHGGFAEYALLPGGWVFPLPAGLSLAETMAIGTPGLSAAMAISRMEDNGLRPERGAVLVTGACGGVGSLAIDMLAGRGYEVVALTGRPEQSEWLLSLGAARVMLHSELMRESGSPLAKGVWAGAVDVLGGAVLSRILSACKPAGVVASVGMLADSQLEASAMPFVLRGVSLLGIDSVYAGFNAREKAWARLAADLRPRHLEKIARQIEFAELPQAFEDFMAARLKGRTIVRIAGCGDTKEQT